MKQHQALFANFILKFGERDLADYLAEIVLPAFTDDKLYRQRSGSTFYLIDVELVNLGPGGAVPAIAGRLVQDTVLRREQILDPVRGLVHDEASLESAPSSFFVLTLTDHRLIYWAETYDAPELSSFAATLSRFLKLKRRELIELLYKTQVAANQRVTKKSLLEFHDEPVLNVVPIAGREEIADFVKRYAVLRRIDIVVHERNAEIGASHVMETLETWREQLKAKRATLTTSSPEGIDQDGAVDALSDAGDGNQDIRLHGIDQFGNKLDGSSEDFSVRTDVELPPLGTAARAAALFDRMRQLVDEGVLRAADISADVQERVRNVLANLL